jgi:hypothetical protein
MLNQFEIETTVYGPKPITGGWGAKASIMVPSAGKKNGPSFLDVVIWNDKDGVALGDQFLKAVNDRDKVLLRGQLRSDKDDDRSNKQPKFIFRVDEFQPVNGTSSGASDAASFFGGTVAGPADQEAFLTDAQIAAEKKKAGKA